MQKLANFFKFHYNLVSKHSFSCKHKTIQPNLMSKSLIPAQRRDRIQEYLTINRIARTADLCDILETSEATVRRDLEWLEQEGILERTHGGAIINQRMVFEPEYPQRAQRHPEEKRRIGALAAAL